MASVIRLSKAKFSVGQLVKHRNYNYRGVVLIVNETYKASEDWYKKFGKPCPRNKPWYHVLIEGSDSSNYVAECYLKPDDELTPIDHPLLKHFFKFNKGKYKSLDSQ